MSRDSPTPSPAPPRLEVDGVSVAFGAMQALDQVSFVVPPRQIVGVIGTNGAGKTTLLDAICGVTPASAGTVRYDGAPLEATPQLLVRLDIARMEQDPGLPPRKTVLDVVVEGGAPPPRTGLGVALRGLFGGGGGRAGEDDGFRDHAVQLFKAFGLTGLADATVESLTHAQRARVAIARAAVGNPRLLLLDEPAAGLDPDERLALAKVVRPLATRPGRDCSIVVVEHHFDVIEQLCDTVVVLDAGRVIATGTPDEVSRDARAREAYLG